VNILVINTAAEYAGSLSILQDFYKEVKKLEKNINWFFCVSNVEYIDQFSANILDFSWTKKSWFHRFFFDYFIVRKLVKKLKIDALFSMQNVTFPGVRVRQIVYFHQSIQFSPYRYRLFKKEEMNFWVRQNIISRYMKKSLNNSFAIIVQSSWFKDRVENWLYPKKIQIRIIKPVIHNYNAREYDLNSARNNFFYPAGGGHHKNHDLIIDACIELKLANINNYAVFFTLNGNENAYVKKIALKVKKHNLPIFFIGNLSKDEVFKYYSICTLLFPSTIETFGLPLLEGIIAKSIIFSSDLPFAHEILDEYNNVSYFDPFDSKFLCNLMRMNIDNTITYNYISNFKIVADSLLTKAVIELASGVQHE